MYRQTRERIIAMEVMKLERRRALERERAEREQREPARSGKLTPAGSAALPR